MGNTNALLCGINTEFSYFGLVKNHPESEGEKAQSVLEVRTFFKKMRRKEMAMLG